MRGRRPRRARPAWEADGDEALLARRLDRLGLDLASDPAGRLPRRLARLGAELAARGLHFRPHVWLSTDWFSPDGVPGFALPFYLAHPRLVRLERRQTQQVEGLGEAEAMRLLRHEAGHAVDTAFRLHAHPRWRDLFGLRSAPYRRTYTADPRSSDFVRHLPRWYAQSHPAEDFAETFAVWLAPRSGWRRRYADPASGARRKLEAVDELLRALAGARPAVGGREETEPLRELAITLEEHYRRRRRRRRREPPAPFEEELAALFPERGAAGGRATAARRIRGLRARLHAAVPRAWRADPYAVDQVLDQLELRCREDARAAVGPGDATLVRRLARLIEGTLAAWAGGHPLAR